MILPRHHSNRKERAQYLLLAFPTAALMAFGIYLGNQWLAVLNHQWIWQSVSFTAGLGLAIFCFARRLRFITLSLAIGGAMILVQWLSKRWMPAELDAYFFIVKTNNFFTLFIAGWLAGYGFSRSRFFSIFWAVAVLSALLLVIANITPPLRKALTLASIPVITYAAYIIYTGEFLRNMNEDQTGFRWFVTRRLLSFGLLLAFVLGIAFSLLKTDFTTIEKEWEDGGKPKQNNERQNSLTRNDGMGTATQPSMGLQGYNNRANKDSVLFVAKLDHFFPDSDIPNPLYFVSDYYTRFDTVSQTFETDSLRPYNDLFQPDLLSLPLYQSLEDSSLFRKNKDLVKRKVITAEVYKTALSPRHFTAPSTAFFVQPISIPHDNKDVYKSAYRTKMLVSELNSAYFVYNPGNDAFLHFFQEMRFNTLRSVTNYMNAPADLMSYYTQMPYGDSFDSIRALARTITDSAKALTPIDQIIAVRNFFTATDSAGNPTFRYSDNPGIPGIPGASKLCYFLFDSKKGYCAYYAGATLFLLRAMGIPSRIATGFLTVDRSNKNPGWYWFYEDQAHAWVQVWFPGYGWLDFDTTVPSAESQEAPQPDQTPPLTSQTVWLVANGNITEVDTAAKKLKLMVSDVLYHDKPYKATPQQLIDIDISMARVLKDTGQVSPGLLQPGMKIVAVSFSDQFKELVPEKEDNFKTLSVKWPVPLPMDEIKIIDPVKESAIINKDSKVKDFPWSRYGKAALGLLGALLLAILLFPFALFSWFAYRAKHLQSIEKMAYNSYMASLLFLHQMGYKRHGKTPLQMAQSKIDPEFNTKLALFIATYQKLKYSKSPLSENEKTILTKHYPGFIAAIKRKIPFKKRFTAFLKPGETLDFFTQPNILGSTKSTNIWDSM